MLIFVTALICAVAVLFASLPAAIDRANRVHIENGREPNAGIAFIPDLIVVIAIWWVAGVVLRYIFDLKTAMTATILVSTSLFVWQIYQARKSSREYAKFLVEQGHGADSEEANKNQQNKAEEPTPNPPSD